ncbi:MAG: helix-turn-helix domain-containing protein [Elusimicrobiota bacterium]|jgi:transcriptional regulator with XRE-family HTH domain|nr:helix-turn-helix domain-containing protein [Elusimicrobiota bacterium]
MNTNERIKFFRKNIKKITLEQFAKKINMTKQNLSKIENGKTNITNRVIDNIAKEFYIRKDWIRNGEGEIFEKKTNLFVQNMIERFEMLDKQYQNYINILVDGILQQKKNNPAKAGKK